MATKKKKKAAAPKTKTKTAVKKAPPTKKVTKKAAPKKALAPKKKAAPKQSAAPKKAPPKKAPPKKAATKKAATKSNGNGGPSPDDKAAFAPGTLVKHDDNYSLVYSNFPHVDAFEEQGLQGGGYTWHGMVEHVMREDAPDALKKLDFDPEGSMFCALSTDLSALAAVGRALKKLEDPALLTKLATTLDLTEYD